MPSPFRQFKFDDKKIHEILDMLPFAMNKPGKIYINKTKKAKDNLKYLKNVDIFFPQALLFAYAKD